MCRAAAATVRAAVDVLDHEQVDLLVSDIGLPDGSGVDLMRRAVQQRRPLKGIAVSGFGMDEDIRRSREAGFEDHIIKPVNVAQLEQAIARLAASAELAQP